MAPPNMALRGLCPVCRRNVALLADHTVAKAHKDGDGNWCAGRGLEGQLFPSPPPDRIRVRQLPHTRRWRVEVGERLAYVCDNHAEALVRADQLAERERERAAEAEFLGLHAERFGDGRRQ